MGDGKVSLPWTLLRREARKSPCFKHLSFLLPSPASPPLATAEFCIRWQQMAKLRTSSQHIHELLDEHMAEPSMLSLHQCTNLSLAAQAPLYGSLLRAYWRCSCGCTWGIPQHSFVPVYKPKENRPHQKESVKTSKERKGDSREFSAYFLGRSFLSSRNMRASAES